MNLYELNQAGYNSLPKMTGVELANAQIKVHQFLCNTSAQFFMLLCNELHYYTIFDIENPSTNYMDVVEELFGLVNELGIIKSIEVTDSMVEFWVTSNNETHMYAFFDYDGGVIKYE